MVGIGSKCASRLRRPGARLAFSQFDCRSSLFLCPNSVSTLGRKGHYQRRSFSIAPQPPLRRKPTLEPPQVPRAQSIARRGSLRRRSACSRDSTASAGHHRASAVRTPCPRSAYPDRATGCSRLDQLRRSDRLSRLNFPAVLLSTTLRGKIFQFFIGTRLECQTCYG
jgi:hypothetical protein